MKIKLSIIASSITLLIGATSCADWLDVRPEGEIILPEFWKTEADAQSVMAACYRGMIENDYVERAFAWGEMRSGEVVKGNSTSENIEDVLLQEIEPTNSYTNWKSFYNVINNCNTFLMYAPNAQKVDESFTPASLHSMEAEVVAIRALSYFYLVRAFDKVPYITTPSIDDTQDYLIPQTKQENILDSLITDLNAVVRYAPSAYHNNVYTKGRITKNAIYSLLADIYLWKGDYQNCINSCNKVIADSTLKLVEASDFFSSVFYSGNSSESIFELQFNDVVQKNGTTANMFGNNGNEGKGSLYFPAALYPTETPGTKSPFNYSINGSVESPDDYRMHDFVRPLSGKVQYAIFKYAGVSRIENPNGDQYNLRSNTSNWIVYRLPDVILMKAEAIIQRDKSFNDRKEASIQEALDLVNRTYLRSNPSSDSLKIASYSTYTDAENLILRERQRELMFEGKRYFDLMRVSRRDGNTTRAANLVAVGSESEKLSTSMSTIESLYWPINQDEIDVNVELKQNPFYLTSKSSSKKK